MKKITFLVLVMLAISKISIAQFEVVFTGVTGNLFEVYFPSDDIGYVVGGQEGYPYIFKTTDGGNSWNGSSVPNVSWLYGVYFLDNNVGFVCGVNGKLLPINGVILKTVDGGQNWDLFSTEIPAPMSSVYFVTANIGYCVGFDGLIFKTTDGGESWIQQISNTDDYLLSVFFTEPDIGFAVGANNAAVKTIDGGTTWTAFSPGELNAWTEITFINGSTGFCTGFAGALVKTTDGGQTWQTLTTGTEAVMQSVTFQDENNGYAVGNGGTILKSQDGGDTWQTEESPVSDDLNDVWMNGSSVIIAGDDGTILKMQSPTATSDLSSEQNILVYPNPGIGDVYVELAAERNNVRVRIVDETGRMVATQYIGTAQHFHIPLEARDGIYFMEISSLKMPPVMLKFIRKQ